MTEEIVTFYAELQRVEGAPEHVGMAALILRKANPSGVPENDAEFVTQILIDTTR
ncbi:MAG: hypothetical protein JKX80_02275 [Candidatus Pacebacteria bacterium]|nr:hypothetical protein [Candidatus Paceibacterota bacterium]